jgi:hypothetical protein
VALLRYVCSLPNPGTKGAVRELFYPDNPEGRARAEKFAQHENKPGRGVYDCIGFLQDGARSRCRDTVAALDQVVADLDLKNIVQRRDAVLQCVKGLVLPPSEIRDSGFGLHLIWHLKEPVEDGDGLTQAETIMKQLAELLAGDLKPTHRAALLRHPGSDNTKEDEPRPCRVLEAGGAVYDISEFGDMFDLYADRALLTPKEAPKTNGHDKHSSFDSEKARVDVVERFAAMTFEGPGDSQVHATQLACTASLMRSGCDLDYVVAEVLGATRRAVAGDRRAAKWDWDEEEHTIRGMCADFVNKLHPELYILLSDRHRQQWEAALASGKKPKLVFSKGPIGWHVRGLPHGERPAPEDPAGASRGSGGDPSASFTATTSPPAPFILRPFTPFDPAKLPPREFLFGKHYQRRVVGGTVAPGDFGKTSLCMVEQVSMATARNLLGEQPKERLRVWYHNGEDSLEELNRRLAAICQHYAIPQSELSGWFFMTSGNEVPLRVARGYSNLVINTGLIENINSQIGDNEIDVATFDPLVTLHGVPENDTGKMDTVVRIFAGIADQQNCAVELSHHTRKLMAGSTADYSVDDMRGAGAVKDAMRAVRMLNRMTPKDAEDVGIPEHERAAYFRLDPVKGNNSRPALATWRRFVNVELPNSDEVGVVVPWEFPGQGAAPSPEKTEAERKVEHVFLTLLARFMTEGRIVNDRPGASNAPNLFAQEPEAKLAKVGKRPLAEAMRRLFQAGKIKCETYGRPGRPSYQLVLA